MKKISLPIRLYIKTALKLDSVIEINNKQTHYLSNVMRKNIKLMDAIPFILLI